MAVKKQNSQYRVDYVADVYGTLLYRMYVSAKSESEARKIAETYKPAVCPSAFGVEVLKVKQV